MSNLGNCPRRNQIMAEFIEYAQTVYLWEIWRGYWLQSLLFYLDIITLCIIADSQIQECYWPFCVPVYYPIVPLSLCYGISSELLLFSLANLPRPITKGHCTKLDRCEMEIMFIPNSLNVI